MRRRCAGGGRAAALITATFAELMEELSVTYVAQVFTRRLPGPHGGLGNRGANRRRVLVLGTGPGAVSVIFRYRHQRQTAIRQGLAPALVWMLSLIHI